MSSYRDNDDESLRELDSLLDSLGPSRDGEEEEDEEDDDDEDSDAEQHMIDTVDPDAVDFTPFLQNHSGTAANYHDESHLITEHHEKLHRKITGLERSPSNSMHGRSRKAPHSVAGSSHQSILTQCYSIPRRLLPKRNPDEEPDRMKFVVYAMLAFILYAFVRHQSPHPAEANQITKAHAPEDTVVPHEMQEAYADVDDLPIGIMDTPIYWHIPRSGGTTMKLIMSMCMGRVVACEQGAGHQLDEQLELLNKPFGNFANVDTSTPLGLQRAAELGLIPSRIVDVVLTPHVREASKLFDSHHKGRLFALFRNPVDRVVSLYYFLRMPDQEASIGLNVRAMSLEQFAADISENWMVRSLTNTMSGPLTEDHLFIAKEILRKKFLVGLLDEKTESLRRIESYFGWKLPSRVSQTCKNNMFYFEPQSKNVHDQIEPESKEYEAVAERNQFDMDLYDYAVQLFEDQKNLIPLK